MTTAPTAPPTTPPTGPTGGPLSATAAVAGAVSGSNTFTGSVVVTVTAHGGTAPYSGTYTLDGSSHPLSGSSPFSIAVAAPAAPTQHTISAVVHDSAGHSYTTAATTWTQNPSSRA